MSATAKPDSYPVLTNRLRAAFDLGLAGCLIGLAGYGALYALLFKVDALDPWNLGLLAGISTSVFTTLISLGHINVRLQAGRASVIFCTPQMHRIHHSRLPQHQDKNFAFIFPFWDVLFGTYYAPGWNEFPPTGVDGEKEIGSFWESQIFTHREWWRMFRAWRQRAQHSRGLSPRPSQDRVP